MRIKQIAVATVATVLTAGTLFAQDAQPQRTTNSQPQTKPVQATSNDSHTKDQIFAKCLAIANEEQVLLARFAKDKVSHPDVKAFASMLEDAHQTSVQQLKTVSSQTEVRRKATDTDNEGNSANRIDREDRAGSTERTDRTVSNATLVAGNRDSNVDFLQLHEEIATQCLKDSKEMLSSKSGIEIDKCFVGMQIAKHAAAHSTLTVLQKHSTGKLQEWIKTDLEMNAKHMEAAVSLMDKLAHSASSAPTRESK